MKQTQQSNSTSFTLASHHGTPADSQTAKQPNSQTVKQSTLIHLTYLLDNQSTE